MAGASTYGMPVSTYGAPTHYGAPTYGAPTYGGSAPTAIAIAGGSAPMGIAMAGGSASMGIPTTGGSAHMGIVTHGAPTIVSHGGAFSPHQMTAVPGAAHTWVPPTSTPVPMTYPAPTTVMAAPVVHHMAPPVITHMAAPMIHHVAPAPVQFAPVTYAAPSPRMVEHVPHPELPVTVVHQIEHPPVRLHHEEAIKMSYVGEHQGNAHLIAHQTNQVNFQATHAMPASEFHHVNKFVHQDDLYRQGAHTMHGGHPAGHFGPKQAVNTAHAYSALRAVDPSCTMHAGSVSHFPGIATYGGAGVPMGAQMNVYASQQAGM